MTTWKLMIATSAGATGPVITADIRPEDVAAILELARRSMHEHERRRLSSQLALEEPSRLLIWRQDTTPMFRELPTEEAMMWDEAANGIPFGVLCEMLATFDDPDGAAARGAGYLHGWISSGSLAGVSAGD